MDVPVQFFQSTITIELAVAGALLWEIRYFDREGGARPERQELPDARLQLFFALVLGATLFGSLWAIADEGEALAASLVTIGVAVSLLPFLVHVLPPLARDARTSERDLLGRDTLSRLRLLAWRSNGCRPSHHKRAADQSCEQIRIARIGSWRYFAGRVGREGSLGSGVIAV